MRYIVALGLLVVACEPAENEAECIRLCHVWAGGCRYDCDSVFGCDDDEGGEFCDAECLEGDGGKPDDCAECFECMQQSHESLYVDGDGMEQQANFCPVTATPSFPQLASALDAPCGAVCAQCL